MILLIFLLALSLSAPAMAGTLDLETATQLAAERSNDASTADLSVQRQEINLRGANLAWTPSVTLNAGGQGSLGRTFSEQLGTNITEPVVSLSTSLTASMALYKGGALRAERDKADASLEASEADQAQTLHNLRWMVADSLLQIEQARAMVQVQEAALEADNALLDQVALQVEAGARTPADLYSQQAVVANRRASGASAIQALSEAELTLLSLLRLEPEEGWSFEAPPALPEVAEADALITAALAQRPDLRAAQDRVQASLAAQQVARSGFLPSVSLGAGTSTSWISSNPDPFSVQLDNQSRSWTSIDLRLPLLDGGVRRAQADTAGVAVKEVEFDRQRLQDQVALNIRLLVAQEQSARALLDASTSATSSARQASEVLTLRYESGAETLVSVTEARAALVNAELGRTWAETALQRIRYQLAWTTGELGRS